MPINAYLAIAAVALVVLSPLVLALSPLWVFWVWRQLRKRRQIGYRTLWPCMARTVVHYARAVVRARPPEGGWRQVARRLDEYIAATRSPRIWRLKLMLLLLELAPLMRLSRPFSMLSPAARRRFVDRNFVARHGLMRVIAMGRQLIRLGYYSCHAPQERMGFVPVSGRHVLTTAPIHKPELAEAAA
jgi:hypothetical protein